MTYLDVHSPTQRVWPAIVAGLALFIAGALSIAGLNLFGAWFSFGFIPLVVLVIWPRRANRLVSLVLVFAAGLFTDWATGGIDGQWVLVFVLVWGFLRPELRSSPFSPVTLISVWLAACLLALAGLSLSGMFAVRVWPDFAAMGRQMILASCLLPLFLLLRQGLAVRLNDRDDWR